MKPSTLLSALSFVCVINICLSQENCGINDNCANAEELIFDSIYDPIGDCDSGPSHISGESITLMRCNSNILKNDSYFQSSCLTPNQQIVWYKFNSGNNQFANLQVKKSGAHPIKSFAVDIFGKCSHISTLIGCDFAGDNDSESDLREIFLLKFTDYYIGVGSRLEDTGTFEITLEVYNIDNFSICSAGPAVITPDKLPPYKSGDLINFEVFVPAFSQTTTILWAQGFIPVFGAGWDHSSFEYLGGEPISSQLPNNNWKWWDEGNIKVNHDIQNFKTYIDKFGRLAICDEGNCPPEAEQCLLQEEYLPAGWYAYQNGAGPNCELNSGHPNLGWGDGAGPWTFKFSLIVGDSQDLDGDIDLSVELHIFSDLQTGCWQVLEEPCKVAPPTIFNSYNSDCNNPPISAGTDFKIDCNEDEFEIIGEGPIDSNFIQYWGTINGKIVGANDSYTIISNSPGNYRLFVEDTITGCVSFDDIKVSYEDIDIDIEISHIECHGDHTGSATVHNDALIEWSTGDTGNTISNLAAGLYSVTMTNGNCIRSRSVRIEQPMFPLKINSTTQINSGLGKINLEVGGGWGNYNIEWCFGGNNIASNVTELEVTASGDYEVVVTDDKGCIEIVIINVDLTTSIIGYEKFKEINVFPNPVKDLLILEGKSINEISSYEIISVTGQTLKKGYRGIQSGQINVSALNAGAYLLKIFNPEGHSGVLKFIKN